MIRMEDAGRFKRWLFGWCMSVARRVGPALLDGKPVGPGDRLAYGLGRVFVYGPLKNTLGLSRIRVGYTAGEAIGPEIFEFYRSLGINLKQLYRHAANIKANIYQLKATRNPPIDKDL